MEARGAGRLPSTVRVRGRRRGAGEVALPSASSAARSRGRSGAGRAPRRHAVRRSWRSLAACHASSSQSTLETTAVAHPQWKSSPYVPAELAARFKAGAAAARPSMTTSRGHPGDDRQDAPCSAGDAIALAALEMPRSILRPSQRERCSPGVETRFTREPGVERLELSALRRAAAVSHPRRALSRGRHGHARARHAPVGGRRRGRPRRRPSMRARHRTLAASTLASAAASARSTRFTGSAVSATACWRNAAAAGSPPRVRAGTADPSSSAATSSREPGVARPRCQARRSGSVPATVASASARCTRQRSWAVAAR